jgi:putative membrane protein
MDYQAVKALHIIFVVSWFAGLFYMVRLFIYHVETKDKPENEAKILQRLQSEKFLVKSILPPSQILLWGESISR